MGGHAFAVVLLGAALIAAGACSGQADGRYASSCPSAALADCPIAPGALNCTRAEIACGLDSLPTGLPCSAPAQCSIPIDPCPDRARYAGTERVDGYVCSCLDGRWSCDDCSMGGSLCAEAPDGAPLAPSVVVDGSDDRDAKAESGVAVGADGAFEAAEPADSPSSASPDRQAPAQCEWLDGDVAEVTVAFTGSEQQAGAGDAVIEWLDDGGIRGSCGPSSCDASCPPGAPCSAAFITHALVHDGGHCR